MFNHDKEDILYDAIKWVNKNRLHNATEGKDNKVGHTEQKSKVDDVIEDVIEGVTIHGSKAGEDR